MQRVVWSHVASVQLPTWKELSKQLDHKLERIRQVIPNAASSIGLGIFVAFAFVPITHWLPLPHGNTPSNVVKAAPAPPTTAQVVNTVSCKDYSAQAGALFATCPSFVADYSKQKSGKVDTSVFTAYQGAPFANEEAQFYTNNAQNLRIENGSLVLEARNEAVDGYKYTSARIDTQHKKDFLYGKFVVRAKLPSGIGTWPAIWMLPSNATYGYGDSANYLNDGELDMVEAIGSQPNTNYSVAHTAAYDNNGVDRRFFDTVTVPTASTDFNDYEMDWTPDTLTFSVDGKVYFTYNKEPGATAYTWPFDQPYYLVLNLALGGSWAGQDRSDFPLDGVDSSALPASLQVQSIKYYSYIGPK